MNNPKIIALYLPQFHCIPENDKFWGKGFTDWVTVRNAKPLFEGHNQPRVPLNDNYYDLSLKENVAWQANLAREHGIYGFGVYHYWFNNEQNLLTKPAEIIRDNDDIDINYFFVWDNGNWIRSWSNLKVQGNDWAPTAEKTNEHKGPQILINYILGGESDWEKHYRYVATHFKQKKYIKIDGKPVFCILNNSTDIFKMCEYWDNLAKKDGFDGMYFIFNNRNIERNCKYARYNYEPHASGFWNSSILKKIEHGIRRILHKDEYLRFYDYDKIWKQILKNTVTQSDDKIFYGAFVGYDDTPRRGRLRGKIVTGSSPEKFKRYFSELWKICQKQKKTFIFLSAWNEWGESMTLEPDTINRFGYLEVVKKVVQN